MGIKKVARPMNRAKNAFLKWINKKNGVHLDGLKNKSCNEWDYYEFVSVFIDGELHMAYFMVWKGRENIYYRNSNNQYDKISIDKFLKLLK